MEEKLSKQEETEKAEEKALEERLTMLVGKKVEGFELGGGGANVYIKFEGGLELSFTSWSARDDVPDPEGVKVTQAE